MTIRFIEGFETVEDTACLARRYSTVLSPGLVTIAGRLHGDCMRSGTGTMLRTRSLSLQDEWTFGFGFRYLNGTVTDETDTFPIVWYKGTTEQIALQWRKVSGENTFEFYIMRGATEVWKSSDEGATGKFTPLNWHYFEFQVGIDPVNGYWEFRHNTSVIGSDAGPVNTADEGTAGADVAEFMWQNGNCEWDDLYILDDQGAVNNDFLGDSVIEGRVPTGEDLTVHDWLINNGGFTSIDEYWEAVNELSCTGNVNSQFIYSDTVSDDAMMTFNALSFITGQVHCVNVRSEARLDVVGTREFAHIVRSGGTIYQPGITHTVASTGYQSFEDYLELDPDTAAKWTVSGVDNADFGVRLIS
jgi:hypothetical protein